MVACTPLHEIRHTDMQSLIPKLLDTPKIIGVIAETNQGKSNMLYHLVNVLNDKTYTLYTFGLRSDVGGHKIYSLSELETIRDSIIIVDEFQTLFDLDDRKNRKAIENSLRLIHHNNNILILCGLPDNYKKYIASKLDVIIYKRCSLASFINGSRTKYICMAYKGEELGASMLNLDVNEALIYDGSYNKITIPYMTKYDTKKDNKPIIKVKKK